MDFVTDVESIDEYVIEDTLDSIFEKKLLTNFLKEKISATELILAIENLYLWHYELRATELAEKIGA